MGNILAIGIGFLVAIIGVTLIVGYQEMMVGSVLVFIGILAFVFGGRQEYM